MRDHAVILKKVYDFDEEHGYPPMLKTTKTLPKAFCEKMIEKADVRWSNRRQRAWLVSRAF